MSVYNRAGLWRIAAFVVLLSLTAVAAGAVARGFRTAPIDGAENIWPPLVTTSHFKYSGYHTPTEQNRNREAPVIWCSE